MQRSLKPTACVGLAGILLVVGAASAPAAQRAYVPGEVIVQYEDGTSAAARSDSYERVDAKGVRILGGLDLARTLEIVGDPEAAAARLERSPAVVHAEPNYVYRASATPDDAGFGGLYGLNNTGQEGGTADADIDAPEGWDAAGLAGFPATGGAKVGIVDTGVVAEHDDLQGKVADCAGVESFGLQLLILPLGGDPSITDGKCADDNGHGTHVAGTIAATANNGTGVAGVAFNSPLAVCKALSGSGSGTLEMVANCIDWTVEKGAKVISMSLGGPGKSELLQAAVKAATDKGALVVAAAGNSGDDTISFPAGYPEAVSVAATDRDDRRAEFSTFNGDVEVAAPGVDITSTWVDGALNTISGTSMATPHAAGVAALIAGGDPAGGPATWRARLTQSVDDLGPPGRDPSFGFGRVNLQKAMSG